MNKFITGGIVVLVLAIGVPALAQSADNSREIEEARQVITEWVDTRQIISKEKSVWREQKQLIEHKIELFTTELEALEEQIIDMEDNRSAAENKRAEAQTRINTAKEAAAVVDGVVAGYETQIQELGTLFPDPLKDKVAMLMTKIPKDKKKTSLTTGERMAVVIGIMNEVDKFNNNVTVVSDLREVPSGETAEVKTLYVGLGQAYSVDAQGRYAFIGTPGKDGWDWTPNNAVAPDILRAIAVYEGVVKPAVYVELPVTIK